MSPCAGLRRRLTSATWSAYLQFALTADYFVATNWRDHHMGQPKRLANLDKRGLDFADLELEFFLDSLVVPVREGRFKAIGPLRGRSMIVVVFASLGTEAVSVISMRPASKKERSLLDDRQSE